MSGMWNEDMCMPVVENAEGSRRQTGIGDECEGKRETGYKCMRRDQVVFFRDPISIQGQGLENLRT